MSFVRLVHDCPKHGEEECDGSKYWHWCRTERGNQGQFFGECRIKFVEAEK